MAGAKIALSGAAGELNNDGNDNAKVNLPLTKANAGFVTQLCEADSGSVTGSRRVLEIEPSEDYRLRVGVDSILFSEWFPGAAINSAIWTAPVTTMTLTQASNYATLNAGLSTASGAVARLTSYNYFPVFGASGLQFRCRAQFSQTPQANNVCEWGMVIHTGTTAPTDGVFFRINAAQELRCVLNVNGTESQSSALNFGTLIGTGGTVNFAIDIREDIANFWINEVLVASLESSTGVGPCGVGQLPISFRNYNSGITAAAQVLKVSHISVLQADADNGIAFEQINAAMGRMGYQGQTGGTMGSTANYANSANPTAAVPTNTTAALGSGLGGQFWETDTLAVTTDGIISSYQVPAGTAALPGRTLYIYGVKISSFVQVALTGGGYNDCWSLAFGHTAVSLATGEAATTKAPRRIALGSRTIASGAVVLTQLPDIYIQFKSPIVVQQGEFVQTVKKKVGTAPSAGVIAHLITFDSHFA